jgi:hypothetical protein
MRMRICMRLCIRIRIRIHIYMQYATITYFDILVDMKTDTRSYVHTSASTHAPAYTRVRTNERGAHP